MTSGNIDLSKSLLDEFEARLERGDSLTSKETIWLLSLARGQIMPVWELYKSELAAEPNWEKSMPELFAEICFVPSEKHNRVAKEDVYAILPFWFKRYVSPVALGPGERFMAKFHQELERRYSYDLFHYLGITLTDEGQKLLQAARAEKEVHA